jgi:putative FmdB family regulatory protein
MPTYSYRCRRCGNEFEKFQKMNEPPRARCPKCRGAAERLISGGGGLLFKGGGFYITDYRSEGYKKAAKAESGESSAKADAKTETKPKIEAPAKPAKPEPAGSRKTESRSGKRGRGSD